MNNYAVPVSGFSESKVCSEHIDAADQWVQTESTKRCTKNLCLKMIWIVVGLLFDNVRMHVWMLIDNVGFLLCLGYYSSWDFCDVLNAENVAMYIGNLLMHNEMLQCTLF